jgi:hypothetical protein
LRPGLCRHFENVERPAISRQMPAFDGRGSRKVFEFALLSERRAKFRNALTQTATLRNVGISMVITAQNLAGMPALAAAVWDQQARTGIAGGAKS